MAGIEYEELEIEVVATHEEVRVLRSQFGCPREDFQPAYDPAEMSCRLERLDELILAGESEEIVSERRELAESIGEDLYKTLFPGRIQGTVNQGLAAMSATRRFTNAGLRLRLSFGEAMDYPPETVGLPWELACSPDDRRFQFSAATTPLVRHLDLNQASNPLEVEPPLRILAVLASPNGLPQIDTDQQKDVLLGACGDDERMQIKFLTPPTLTHLRDTLRSAKNANMPFHAFHFLGHGAFDPDGRGYLNFERENRQRQRVQGRDLAQILKDFSLAFALLSTCKGARMMRRKGQHPFTGSASALVASGMPAVIAMQFPLSEKASRHFNHSFYGSLKQGRPLEEAVTEGRLRILSENPNNFEWASPVLFLRSRDGKVLSLPKKKDQEASLGSDSHSDSITITSSRDISIGNSIVNKVHGDQFNVQGDMSVHRGSSRR